MTGLYGWLVTLMSVDLPTWFNNKLGWFFKNGNKAIKMKETEPNFGTHNYKLTENEHTVIIEMPKPVFTSIMRVTRFGNDCIRFKSLPDKMPAKAGGASSAISGLSYEAFKIGREAHEERMRNKLKTTNK